MTKHNHYFKNVAHLQQVDVYRILELFEVTCPVAQHIVKKALAAGKRGAKSPARDMQDIVDSAQRWLAMREEDAKVLDAAACEPTRVYPKGDPLKDSFDSWRLPPNIHVRDAMVKFSDAQPTGVPSARIDPVGFIHSMDAAYNLTKGAA